MCIFTVPTENTKVSKFDAKLIKRLGGRKIGIIKGGAVYDDGVSDVAIYQLLKTSKKIVSYQKKIAKN